MKKIILVCMLCITVLVLGACSPAAQPTKAPEAAQPEEGGKLPDLKGREVVIAIEKCLSAF
jgi:hypothetical protein